VQFPKTAGSGGGAPNRRALLLELKPYYDDGKQWVLYTDGSCRRAEIDPQLVATYHLAIAPATDRKGPEPEEKIPDYADGNYTIFAEIGKRAAISPLTLTLEHSTNPEPAHLTWTVSDAPANSDATIPVLFDYARYLEWEAYRDLLPRSPVYRAWLGKRRWGPDDLAEARRMGLDRSGEQVDVFGVLGGRAALEETLQMRALSQDRSAGEAGGIPVTSISGVVVKSHPFKEMLAGAEGGRLPLADYVPADHFFVYSPKPAAFLPLLDDGGDFVARLGGQLQANGIDYDLKNRYLARLGMTGRWMRKFIEAGMLKEMALFSPDLFFIEGTDVTVVSRLANPLLAKPLLRLVGIGTLSGDRIFSRSLDDGGKTYWFLRNDLLVISTNRSEIEAVAKLVDAGGEGGLGRSAEFRYMLTQTPLRPETRCYAYFSDPFIRHLVGPAAKIGQLRRLTARKNLEELTAASLRARYDGLSAPISLAALERAGYVSRDLAGDELTLHTDGVAESRRYGTLAHPRTLADNPVKTVSEAEATAYKRYLDNYNRYWRQYFDPIALRLDDRANGGLELTTFILPLLDSSIYRGLKGFLANRETGAPLRVPVTSPEPLLMFSLNLDPRGWGRMKRDLSEFLARYSRLNPNIVRDLGPSLHLAVKDGDPVVTLGSGDILGAFNIDAPRLGRSGEMMMVPLALSVLTRPCTLYVETANPDRTRRLLREATSRPLPVGDFGRGDLQADYYQVAGRDEWILAVKILGVVKLRYGIGVEGKYLVVRNIPWSPPERLDRERTAEMNGARLQVFPAACDLQMPGLFASASERERQVAMQGMGYLYPLLASGQSTLAEAAATHARLFGFRPDFPPGIGLAWNGRDLTSKLFGSVRAQRQPPYVKGVADFGLLKKIDVLGLNLQFEATGLRTVLSWKLRE
jgi:hypothetical protein